MKKNEKNGGAPLSTTTTAKQTKSMDGYLVADVLIFITVLLFLLMFWKKLHQIYFMVGMGATAASLILQTTFGKAQVISHSQADIYVKNEEDATVLSVAQHHCGTDIDGVKIGSMVYKVPDGVHAVVNRDNQLKIRSLLGRVIYQARGGKLTTAPDEAWQPLFRNLSE